MICSKDHFLSRIEDTDVSPLSTEETLEILDFSKRCLMPWIGIRYALWAVKHSKDTRALVGLAARAELFDDIDLGSEDGNWRRVVDQVVQSLADAILEATRLPDFARMSLHTLQKIIELIGDGEWSKKHSIEVAAARTGEEDTFNSSPVPGLTLRLQCSGQRINIYALESSGMSDHFRVWAVKLILMRLSVTAVAREGENQRDVVAITNFFEHSRVYSRFFTERFEHGNPPAYKFRIKVQISKIHLQCLALVSFYAGTQGIARDRASLLHVWRYFRNLECAELIEIARKFMCMHFGSIQYDQGFEELTYDEIESIISDDNYLEDVYEVFVLRFLIGWAKHQSLQACTVIKGDVVRLRSDCREHSDLQGRDCLVKNVSGNTLTIKHICSSSAQVFEVDKQHVYDAGQYAFIKLLRHVRMGSMCVSDLNFILRDLRYVNKIPEFRESLKRMIDVQIGNKSAYILGVQAGPRKTCTKQPRGRSEYADITKLLWYVIDDAEKEAVGLVQERKEHEKRIKELVDNCTQHQQVINNLNAKCKQEQQQLRQVQGETAQHKPERGQKQQCIEGSDADRRQTQAHSSRQPADQLQLLIASMTPEQLEALAAEKRSAVVLARSTSSTDHAAEASASATRGSKRKQVSQKAESQESKKQRNPSHVTKGS